MPAPVSDFFIVTFSSREEVAHFGMQLLDATTSPRGIQLSATGSRPVAFQSLMPRGEQTAYVSPGAAKLMAAIGAGFVINSAPLPLRELPDGLALLVGDQADLTAYENRRV
jgi:hypothetical protein